MLLEPEFREHRAAASVRRMSSAVLPSNRANSTAISPRTMWASLSPWNSSTAGAPSPFAARRAGEPDLAGAAAHLVGVRAQRLGQRRQLAPQLDQIAIAVLPVVEQRKVRADSHRSTWSTAASGFSVLVRRRCRTSAGSAARRVRAYLSIWPQSPHAQGVSGSTPARPLRCPSAASGPRQAGCMSMGDSVPPRRCCWRWCSCLAARCVRLWRAPRADQVADQARPELGLLEEGGPGFRAHGAGRGRCGRRTW